MSARIARPMVIVAALVLLVTAAAPAPWSGLRLGPDGVGYRRLLDDGSSIDVWYPARVGGSPMRFADLLDDSSRTASFLRGAGVPAGEVASLMASPLVARRDAPPRTARVPLVLVAQGNGQSAADQAVLCEYLASSGYVVASTPSPMLRAPLEREDQVGSFAEAQCGDLAAAVTAVARAMPVDTTRLGVVGHSFGARAALLLAMRNPRVRALVSLDGGIGTATALASFRSAPSFRATAPLPPILHFYERLDSFMAPDFTLLHELHARPLTLREVHDLHHAHFTSYGFAVTQSPGLATVTHATPATAVSARGVAEQARAFLDRALRGAR